MDNLALSLFVLFNITNPSFGTANYYVSETPSYINSIASSEIIIEKSISLDERYGNEFVNNVFKDNILLTLNYLSGEVKEKSDIDWEKVNALKFYKFSLNPGETFAFHEEVLPEIQNVVKTTNAHFNFTDGFKSDGYLMGDGVCHLASLIYWAASDAGLNAVSKVNHDFAKINGVPKEYGVSIYYTPDNLQKSRNENLYITNNLDNEVMFLFSYDGVDLNLKILKAIY